MKRGDTVWVNGKVQTTIEIFNVRRVVLKFSPTMRWRTDISNIKTEDNRLVVYSDIFKW